MEEKERYELIGYCSYRDTETGRVGDNFVGVLNEQDQKIKDLEAKLAESKRNNLILYSMLYQTLEKQGCDNIPSEINQMTGLMLEKQADWFKGNRNYDQLKQQLAEEKNRNKKLNHEAQKYYEDAYCNDFQNQKAIWECKKCGKCLEVIN